MSAAKDGSWFTEISSLWPGTGLALKVDEVLFKGRSDFQDVAVVKTQAFGTVLILDGAIQCTDRDEFSYQEMIAHLPACALPAPPKKALVVGGGDGGVLRELSRHASLEEIHIAEIDGMVIDVSKKHFPQMAAGYTDPRVKVLVHVCDGIKFVQDAAEGTYDLIVVDSSDPVGPAEVLFQKPFFDAMHRALKPGGIVCTQAESLWYHLEIIKSLAAMCAEVFQGGAVQYAFTTIPTYPSGQIGFMICTKAGGSAPLDAREPRQPLPVTPEGRDYPPLRYYNHDVHRAAFVLPTFAKEALGPSLTY
ncbi:hypothetical protein CHLNCDRAFT_26108 [Chlorella variabilis]|uniref:spermidine synthase n=1 Tax=Chlorella variabilis TaxID=554065 RepID=E1ZLK5_CHLVA|nr:hypothetical protein CHLNCDRAFT_26108 [Chlorella variabilis]EFN53284.1 hypothetical protein CHLNCDRAFT_26108 [Chlorella variabilis]|eukprot:XP_005845386.1 hypothetical protein CHLNCDRAFT_26108 [Chlorella variabilis]